MWHSNRMNDSGQMVFTIKVNVFLNIARSYNPRSHYSNTINLAKNDIEKVPGSAFYFVIYCYLMFMLLEWGCMVRIRKNCNRQAAENFWDQGKLLICLTIDVELNFMLNPSRMASRFSVKKFHDSWFMKIVFLEIFYAFKRL